MSPAREGLVLRVWTEAGEENHPQEPSFDTKKGRQQGRIPHKELVQCRVSRRTRSRTEPRLLPKARRWVSGIPSGTAPRIGSTTLAGVGAFRAASVRANEGVGVRRSSPFQLEPAFQGAFWTACPEKQGQDTHRQGSTCGFLVFSRGSRLLGVLQSSVTLRTRHADACRLQAQRQAPT